MKKWYYLILFLVVFTGCASKPEVIAPTADKPSTKIPPPLFGQDSQPTNIPTGMNIGVEPTSTNDASLAPEEKTIYFDYDMSGLRIAAQIILKKHAAYLLENQGVTVRLEGHADERGSTEYNLALGEQRAEAAKDMLINLGISDSQVYSLSYGEERPIVFGHSEESWQLNRRVELVYEY